MFTTGLRFGLTTADAATVTSTGAIEGLTAWTVVSWFRIRSLTTSGSIVVKGSGAGNNRRINVVVTTAGGINVAMDRTSDLLYSVPSGTLAINQSYGLVVTCNTSGSAGDLIRFYLTTPNRYLGLIRPTTTTDGSGGFTSDVGANLVWGNNTVPNLAGAVDLYAGIISTVALEPAEAEGVLRRPRTAVRGTAGRWHFGNGGATVWDQSGNGRHAAVSRAVPIASAWDSARWPRPRVATAAAAAFLSAWARGSNAVYQPGVH